MKITGADSPTCRFSAFLLVAAGGYQDVDFTPLIHGVTVLIRPMASRVAEG